MKAPLHYGDYLHLDTLLNAQQPASDRLGKPAHDEMLFIITHQAYELWFKQILHELRAVIHLLQQPTLNDNSPALQIIVHRLSRVVTILRLLAQQIDVMETMTPMDFLDFRDMLRPASGFQSWQFKLVEALLGLRYDQRFGKDYYISQLQPHEVALILEAEKEKSVLELVNAWLERMPFFAEADNWQSFPDAGTHSIPFAVGEQRGAQKFWAAYFTNYKESLDEVEGAHIDTFQQVFGETDAATSEENRIGLSPGAARAALFIMLYRGYPLLHLPFQLLQVLLEVDEQLSTWRYRHMAMVHRMIGTRIGTGGSTGKTYLKGALDAHGIFRGLAGLTSFLVERCRVPDLPIAMERRLGFNRKEG